MSDLKEITFTDMGGKNMSAGLVEGDAVERVYLRYAYADPEKNLTILMTEAEALALIHMLSGVVLAALGASIGDVDGAGAELDPGEVGPPGSKGSAAAIA